MQKKKFALIFVIVIFSLTAFFAVNADNEWTAVQPAKTDAGLMECTVIGQLGPNEKVTEILPPISDEDWSIGPENAALTILEYADFQCPYCSDAGIALLDFQKQNPEDVRYVYRHFPLSFHEKAPMAAYAADAAGAQGLFFVAEEFLYGTQAEWTAIETLDAFETWLKEKFKTEIAGLDYDQWLIDYGSTDIRAKVDGAFDKVAAYGIIEGTPSVFLNFNGYQGSFDAVSLKKYVDLFKLQSRVYDACPPLMLDDSKEYRALVDTTKGQITIDLLADKAPLAVNNFLFLANEGWFDQVGFHRIVPDFVAQTGDPSGTGLGTPGYYFADETSDAKFGDPGMVGMANSGAGKNGSQFFFTYDLHNYYLQSITDANAGLEGEDKLTDEMIEVEVQKQLDSLAESYTVFGKISDGYDVIGSLAQGDQILSVKVEEKSK
ncbi:MAG: peptidylprolyl isomerase [Flexilinea sp.]